MTTKHFWISQWKKQEAYEKLIEMLRTCQNVLKCHHDCTTVLFIRIFHIIKSIINLLVSIYQDKQIQVFFNKLIFVGKLDGYDSAAMLFIAKKQQKIIINFFKIH